MSLTLKTPVNDVFRRDYEMADTDLLDPDHTDDTPLQQGEWVSLDGNGKAVRCTAGSSANIAFQVFTQKGDYSAQALGKVAVLQLHQYEAETDMYDTNSSTTYAIGQSLTVVEPSAGDEETMSVLTNEYDIDSDFLVGTVVGVDSSAGTITFIRMPPTMANESSAT
jgi:hypothetical protein